MEIRQSFEVIISYLKLFQGCDINFIYNLNSKRAICEIDKKVFDVNLFIHNLQFQRIEDGKYIHGGQICTPEKLEGTHPFVLGNLQIKGKYAVLNGNIVYRPVILTSSEEEFERQKKINEKKKLAKDLVKRINNTEEIQDKINALYKNILVNNYNLYKFNGLDYVIKNGSDGYYWCLVDSFASCYNKIRTGGTKITNILDNDISYETILKFIKDGGELGIGVHTYLNDGYEIINTTNGNSKLSDSIINILESAKDITGNTNYGLMDDSYVYSHVGIMHKRPLIFAGIFHSNNNVIKNNFQNTEQDSLLKIRALNQELKGIDTEYIEGQIDAVLDLPEVNDISYKSGIFTIKTNDIWINKFYDDESHINDINAGEYEINVSKSGVIKVFRRPKQGEYNHPHVHRDGNMCTESFGDILSTSSKKLDILTLTFNIINHLQTYNASSPYQSIESRGDGLERRPLTGFSLDRNGKATKRLHIYIK